MKKRKVALSLILICILSIVVIFSISPRPAVFMLKQVAELKKFKPTENIDEIKKVVNIEENIDYANKYHNSTMDILYPKKITGKLPIVMMIHGGGFCIADKKDNRDYCAMIAAKGYLVASINYGLAPEVKYPEPVLQANEALGFLQLNAERYNGDINNIFIGGNSAGAQIASQVGALITNEKFSNEMAITPTIRKDKLKGMLLFNGCYNMDNIKETKFPFISQMLWAYTGKKDFVKYERVDEMSTIKNVTSDYPPVFITAGDKDPMEQQSKEFSDVLENLDVKVKKVLYDGVDAGLGHDYAFSFDNKYSQDVYELLISFLSDHTKVK